MRFHVRSDKTLGAKRRSYWIWDAHLNFYGKRFRTKKAAEAEAKELNRQAESFTDGYIRHRGALAIHQGGGESSPRPWRKHMKIELIQGGAA